MSHAPGNAAARRAGVTAAAARVVVAVLLIGAPIFVHVAMIIHFGTEAAGLLLIAQAVAITWMVLSMPDVFGAGALRGWVRVAGCAVVATGMGGLWWRYPDGLAVASAVPHAISYLGLLGLFAVSLAPGAEPLVSMMARRLRGPLPEVLERYTRRLTVLWCGFFVAQLAVSAALGLAVAGGIVGPEVWSRFVNLWNLPLLGGFFVAEYVYRRWRFAGLNPTRFVDVLRQARKIRPGAGAADALSGVPGHDR